MAIDWQKIDWKKLGSRASISVIGVLCGSVLLAMFLGPRLFPYYLVGKMRRREPLLATIPQPLKDSKAATAEGVTLSRYGYEFEIPWKDIDRINNLKTTTWVIFKSGRNVMVDDPSQKPDRIQVMREQAAEDGHDVRDLFGAATVASNYQLVNAELTMTPERVTLLMPGKELARDFTLLLLKGAEALNTESGLYSVEAHGFRGFQKGAPEAGQDRVVLQLFDAQDRELNLSIFVDSRKNAPITQGDVNRVIQTLHRTETPSEPAGLGN